MSNVNLTINTNKRDFMLVLSDVIFNIGLSLSLFAKASVQQFLAVDDHLLQKKTITKWDH